MGTKAEIDEIRRKAQEVEKRQDAHYLKRIRQQVKDGKQPEIIEVVRHMEQSLQQAESSGDTERARLLQQILERKRKSAIYRAATGMEDDSDVER